ncbi:MAG TPA: sodium ion-translocating decarboxylase subunit beta, partial [Candidatus Competibacter sp.]|nr:sodium ion-translocating decarboxylase subunit beta [Candidatus Competibacter sp.]
DIAPWALAATALAWFTRALSLRRNARLKPKSTTQTATGIQAARVVQKFVSGHTDGQVNPLMAAMGPNVAGVIGSAVAAGMFLALLR